MKLGLMVIGGTAVAVLAAYVVALVVYWRHLAELGKADGEWLGC